jgi:cyclopropane fatty-acyl-phospholipid synthase-like methyltransferase
MGSMAMSNEAERGMSYDRAFFSNISTGSRTSARKVLPVAMEVQRCRSIIDVGCGTGAWLAAAAESGVADVIGVDGGYVNLDQLEIPRERFVAADLSTLTFAALRAAPAVGDRRFDMAMSLEVAEHLPEAAAAGFVALLTSLSDVVLFSAAIPFQGGTAHLNEQFPSWWARHFASRGFMALDIVRDRVWDDASVEWWYRQNVMLFVASHHPAASLARPSVTLDRIHPVHYRRLVDWGLQGAASSGRLWSNQEQAMTATWPR